MTLGLDVKMGSQIQCFSNWKFTLNLFNPFMHKSLLLKCKTRLEWKVCVLFSIKGMVLSTVVTSMHERVNISNSQSPIVSQEEYFI